MTWGLQEKNKGWGHCRQLASLVFCSTLTGNMKKTDILYWPAQTAVNPAVDFKHITPEVFSSCETVQDIFLFLTEIFTDVVVHLSPTELNLPVAGAFTAPLTHCLRNKSKRKKECKCLICPCKSAATRLNVDTTVALASARYEKYSNILYMYMIYFRSSNCFL